MSQVIVIEFVSLDGVIQDPDGSDGSPWGGWAFRHGPEVVAGDKFELLGQGRRLFDQPGQPIGLDLAAAESVGQAVRLVYNRDSAR